VNWTLLTAKSPQARWFSPLFDHRIRSARSRFSQEVAGLDGPATVYASKKYGAYA
jgi:hypothetical protein